MDNGPIIKKAWTVLLENLCLNLEKPMILAFDVDIDHDGQTELGVQFGDYFFALKSGKVVRESTQTILVPIGDGSDANPYGYIEGQNHLLRLVRKGEVVHLLELSRKAFGLGLTHERMSSWNFDSEQLGFYQERSDIVGIAIHETKAEGVLRVFVLQNNGILSVLDGALTLLDRIRIHRGELSLTEMYVSELENGEYRLLISTYHNNRRRFMIFLKLDFAWNITVVQGGKVRCKYDDERIIGCVNPRLTRFITSNYEILDVAGNHVVKDRSGLSKKKEAFGNGWYEVRNPVNPGKILFLMCDPTAERFEVLNEHGDSLWNDRLPKSDTGSWNIECALSPENVKGGPFMAFFFKTEQHVSEYNTNVSREYLRLYHESGILMGAYEFSPNGGDRYSTPHLIVYPSERENEILILLIDSDSVRAFSFNGSKNEEETTSPDRLIESLPKFESPGEDLWSLSIKGLVSGNKQATSSNSKDI